MLVLLGVRRPETSATDGLQQNFFQVVGHDDAALEVLCCFACIGLAACGESLLLGVIEQQVLHAEFGGEFTGIECCAMRLLVGLELLAGCVEAECLAEEPVGVFYELSVL